MNRNRLVPATAVVLLLSSLLLISCGSGFPVPQDSYEEVTLTPIPTDEPAADVPITEDASGIARAFFKAWEDDDLLGMYSLLSTQSQALVDSQSFTERYQNAMETARVTAVHHQPLSIVQEGSQAEFGVRTTWQTAVVGDIVRDYTMPLIYENGRWGVVWDEGLILPELAGGNYLRLDYRIPSRGNIYDKNGLALAYQGNILTLGVIPGDIEDEAGMLNALSVVLNKSPEAIKESYAAAQSDWYWPIGDVPEAVMQEHIDLLQPYIDHGLAPPESRLSRVYGEDGVAPHVVGYIGGIPAESLWAYQQEGYRGDEVVGLAGLELWGEDYLNGERGGTLSIVGANGEYISTLQETDPKGARSLYTTIDRDFQKEVEAALAEALQPLGTQGAVVVMDVNTGAILAMVSYPSYDPAIFDPIADDEGAALSVMLNDPRRPLLNRATQGAYPAGSVFKIVTMAAGLNSGIYTPDTRYTSTGSWDRMGPNFIKYDWREGGHGTVSLRTALIVSCNSCFYDVGFNVNNEVDPYLLPETARAFGLGSETGIQIPEEDGLIPDPDWKINNVGEGWVPGDAVNMAIGQGFVQVTPLQIATFMSAIANGGTIYQPTVIDRLGAGGGAPEEAWPTQVTGQLPISPEHLAVIQDSLWNVANNENIGTAAFQFVGMPIEMAGKTGTAEAPPGNSHAWFAGCAPSTPYTKSDGTLIEEPEIAIAIIAEHAGEGSAVAAPIFRRIVEIYYDITPQRPYPWVPTE